MSADDQPPIRYDVVGRVATLALDRPEKLNAITFAMRDALIERLQQAAMDPDVGVIVVEGRGRAFTAGVDLADRPDLMHSSDRGIEADEAEIETAARAWETMLRIPKPIVVKTQGYCVGWGLEIALHGDIVLASEDCQFSYPSVTMGTGLPDSSTTVYHLGPQWAKRLLLAGDVIDGRTAERIGLVSEALPADELDAAVDALAQRMAALAPELLAQSKRIINESIELQGRATLQAFAVKANAEARREILSTDRDRSGVR